MSLDGTTCIEHCPEGTKPVDDGRYCRCEDGTVLSHNGRFCIERESCKGIGEIDEDLMTCTCVGGAEADEDGVCKCVDSLIGVAQNACVESCP